MAPTLAKSKSELAYDDKLVNRVRVAIAGVPGVGERKMFGGVCFTVDGHMACGVQESDLMIRVGPENHASALSRAHARPMDFTGRPMRGYVYVSEAGHKRADQLRRWVGQGVDFVQTLPPKVKKVSKKKR